MRHGNPRPHVDDEMVTDRTIATARGLLGKDYTMASYRCSMYSQLAWTTMPPRTSAEPRRGWRYGGLSGREKRGGSGRVHAIGGPIAIAKDEGQCAVDTVHGDKFSGFLEADRASMRQELPDL